jgi:hypothetical protein
MALTEKNRFARDTYVQEIVKHTCVVDTTAKRTVIYLDESYIHKNYARQDDSLYDPNDHDDLHVKSAASRPRTTMECLTVPTRSSSVICWLSSDVWVS